MRRYKTLHTQPAVPATARRALGMKALVPYRVLKIGSGELYRGNCVYLVRQGSRRGGQAARAAC